MARNDYWKMFAIRAGIVLVCFFLTVQGMMDAETGAGISGEMYPGPDGQMYPEMDGEMYPGAGGEMGAGAGEDALLGVLAGLVMIWVAVVGIAEAARRLHDTGKSGWWNLINLIPYLGFFVLIYLLAQPGNPGGNEYGPVPDATTAT